MVIEFYKYQATGNDFIIIDDRENIFDVNDSSPFQVWPNTILKSMIVLKIVFSCVEVWGLSSRIS